MVLAGQIWQTVIENKYLVSTAYVGRSRRLPNLPGYETMIFPLHQDESPDTGVVLHCRRAHGCDLAAKIHEDFVKKLKNSLN